MTESITVRQSGFLHSIFKNPNANQSRLSCTCTKGAPKFALASLAQPDKTRERASDCFHFPQFGEMGLRRRL